MTSRRFETSAEQVYEAWLDPDKVGAWMASALKGFGFGFGFGFGLSGEMRRVEIDPRVGGRFCFSDMRNGMEAVHRGEYLELVRPRRIVFTWIVGESVVGDENADPPSRVTLTIQPDGTGCIATIIHEMDAKWAECVSRTEPGWAGMLQAIETLYQSTGAP
jgi:uncharacterized protein YndB with AHSA1/START domain